MSITSASYSTGLWGENRIGVGAFYFNVKPQIHYYVDLYKLNPMGTGTSSDTFNFTSMQTSVRGLSSNDYEYIYHITRSNYTQYSNSFDFTNSAVDDVTFQNWEGINYDFWELYTEGDVYFTCATSTTTNPFNRGWKIKNGKIYSKGNIYFGENEVYNMFIVGNVNSYNSRFYGDTFLSTSAEVCNFTQGVSSYNYFTDSIFDINFKEVGLNHNTSAYCNNCAFQNIQTEIYYLEDINLSCQFDWINPYYRNPPGPSILPLEYLYHWKRYFNNLTVTGTGNWNQPINPYESYGIGLFGDDFDRLGIGSFYFRLLEHYVDLDVLTSGNAGTSADPFNYEDMIRHINVSAESAEIYNIRGRRVVSGNCFFTPSFANSLQLNDWDSSLYGPWILDVSGTLNLVAYDPNVGSKTFLKNGIIKCTSASLYNIELKTVYLKCNQVTLRRTNVFGSSIISGKFIIESNDYMSIVNSILGGDNWSFQSPATSYQITNFINSVVTSGGYSFASQNLGAYYWIIPNNMPTVSVDDENLDYSYQTLGYDLITTGTSAHWNTNEYDVGLWGEDRYGIGAFYFDEAVPSTGLGHIGAFYFGNINEVVSASYMELSVVLLEPIVSASDFSTSASYSVPVFYVNPVLLQPTVVSYQDVEIDFVGVPRAGLSPLTVDFTAFVKFSPENKGKYRVKEYRWCFDYNYNNGTCNIPWVTTTQNPITHVYTGKRGQKFSVKCSVILEAIA